MNHVRAIDVSVHQGHIDWHRVAQTDIVGAWIKVGGADAGRYTDPRAGENMIGAGDAGIPWGTYYFAHPMPGDAVTQARHAVAVGHGRGSLWPALDLESHCGLTGDQLDTFALAFCAEVRRLTGRESIIYTGAWVGSFDRGYFGRHPELGSCALWIANYGANRPSSTPPAWDPDIPPAWSDWAVWQHNSVTVVPGITANTCDQNAVKAEFWARMAQSVTPREDWMNKAILVEGEAAQWRLVDDGNAVLRRQAIPSQARAGVLAKGGVIAGQDDLAILTDPAEIADFRSIPVANDQPADIGALRLATAVIAEVRAAAGSHVSAEDIADVLAERLAE